MARKPSDEDLRQRIRTLEEESAKRRQAEASLRDSEERYRLLVENANDAILVIQDGVVKFVNGKAIASFGYSEREFLSLPILELIHPEDRDIVTQRYLQKLDGDCTPTRHTYRCVHKGGRVQWIENSSVMIQWEGRPATLNLIMDVTERQRAEEELRKSENRLKAQYHGNPIPTFTWQKRGNEFILTGLNDSARILTGARGDAFLGRRASEMYANRQEILEGLRQCLDGRKIIRMESRSEHFMPGRIVVITFAFIPPDLVMVHMEDVTERRRAEEALRESERRYRFLAEKINDILWIMDLDLRTVYVTPSIETVLGFTPEERLRQNVEEQLTPASLSTAMETLSGELAFEEQGNADPDRSVTLTLEFYHRDGSTRWLETIISGIRDDGGVLTRLYGVSRDVTRRRAAEEALKTANKQLEEANRSLGLAYAWMRDRKDQLKKQLFREEMGILLNNDGLIEGLSEKVMEHLGRSRDRLIGHPVRDLIKEEYREDFSREFRQAWMGPSQEVFVEFLDTKDRSKIFDVKLTRLTLSGSRLVLMTLR